MSWNPRRLAAVDVHGGDDPILLWLPAEAVARIVDGIAAGAIEYTDEKPTQPVVVGLGTPIATTHGEVSVLVGRVGEPWELVATSARAVANPAPVVTDRATLMDNVLANITPDMLRSNRMVSAFTRSGADVGEVFLDAKTGDPIFSGPPPSDWTCGEMLPGQMLRGILHQALYGEDARLLGALHRAAWTLYCEPVEREITATELVGQRVSTGKGRRGRDYDVSVIDVRSPSGVRYRPTGEPIEHDHRWIRRGHWRRQAFGKGHAERRRIWIEQQVCGPADKPLINKTKVNVVR
ncbi:hypothetical protein [Mycolicibacter minnesotensis]